MQRILKYPINPITELELPLGSKVLSIGLQKDKPVLWALVDEEARPIRTRRFIAWPTGSYIANGEFLGTFQMENGLVFHVFEEVKE